jgi:hypothetical protein
VRVYRAANLELVRARDRARANLPHRVAAREAYRTANPAASRRGQKAWIKRNPEKRAAHNILNRAVRDGKIMKPKVCEKCGAAGRIEAHHTDYSKPLEVVWLCRRHHIETFT